METASALGQNEEQRTGARLESAQHNTFNTINSHREGAIVSRMGDPAPLGATRFCFHTLPTWAVEGDAQSAWRKYAFEVTQ